MERIKNIDKVILRGDQIWGEVYIIESNIILPDEAVAKSGLDYIKVISVGKNVEDYEAGDIILEVLGNVDGYDLNGKRYCRISRQNVTIGVKADNFDKTKKAKKKVNLKS